LQVVIPPLKFRMSTKALSTQTLARSSTGIQTFSTLLARLFPRMSGGKELEADTLVRPTLKELSKDSWLKLNFPHKWETQFVLRQEIQAHQPQQPQAPPQPLT
jgi:hypothetical protein